MGRIAVKTNLKLDNDSTFAHHEACPQCNSKDNLARYTDGHAYCFGHNCGYYEPPTDIIKPIQMTNKSKTTQFIKGEYLDLPKRKIFADTCSKFRYQCNDKYQIANYYNNQGELVAQKLRTKDKQFRWIGDTSDILMFGQQNYNSGKMLVITEGEIDALTISQHCFKNTYAVVSIPMGVSSAAKYVARHLNWIDQFESVVFCFDSDEVGKAAAVECAKIIPTGKAKIADLELKDANEMVVNHKSQQLTNSIYNARLYRPDGIIAWEDTWDTLFDYLEKPSIPYPYEQLNSLTSGIRPSEIVTLTAGSGIGKSSVCREIAHHIFSLGHKVGYLAYEENTERSALGILSIEENLPLHDPAVSKLIDKKLLKEKFDKFAGRIYFDKHWGSSDISSILNKIRNLKQMGCHYIFLDHINILVSGINDGDERRLIDNLMTSLRKLVQELNIALITVCHLKRLEGNRDHVDGARTSLGHLRGSGAIAQLSDMVLGCERNQQDEENKNLMTIRVLKNRFLGKTGIACQLQYDDKSGRLLELGNMQHTNGQEGRETNY
jgi:twinkle protein